VKIEQARENVFRLTGTSQELSALVAAARMSYQAMLDDERAPAELVSLLERVLADWDRALQDRP
jgi:hypothetical protein